MIGVPVGRDQHEVGGGGHAATSDLRGAATRPLAGHDDAGEKSSPPQTPHGSRRSRAPARQASRSGQGPQRALAGSTSAGDSANHSSGSSTRTGHLGRDVLVDVVDERVEQGHQLHGKPPRTSSAAAVTTAGVRPAARVLRRVEQYVKDQSKQGSTNPEP